MKYEVQLTEKVKFQLEDLLTYLETTFGKPSANKLYHALYHRHRKFGDLSIVWFRGRWSGHKEVRTSQEVHFVL